MNCHTVVIEWLCATMKRIIPVLTDKYSSLVVVKLQMILDVGIVHLVF